MTNHSRVAALLNTASLRIPGLRQLPLGPVVFGSSAIILRGVILPRNIDDLDLFFSDAEFEEVSQFGELREKSPGVFVIDFGSKVEGWRTFPGVDFDGVYARSGVTSDSGGFSVGALEDLLIWKQTQGRPKDLADLPLIRARLASGS